MVRADHPNNVKRGGVCAYVRETLPFRNFSNSYLTECLTLEVTISNRKGYIITLYRSPSQTSDEFQYFSSDLEKLLININSFDLHFVILLGDFNAKSKSGSIYDTTTEEGTILENVTPLFGLNQLTCIDLIFVNQPNLVIDSVIHPSLHQNCHYQIIFCKLNLKIDYPPPYAHEVWDYGKAQTDLINRAIDQFDWINLFLDKNINEQVILFNRTILNIFHNFISNKIILCDDRDPPWMNEKIKHLINKKKAIFRKQKESNTVDHAILSNITLELSNAITFSKDKYHERLAIKLNDSKTTPKTYWSILKTFSNGSKIPLIPPLLVNNEFVTDFLEKANLFNDFFREQCRPITNDSSLPNKPTIETVTRLSDINIETDTIIKLICSLDPNKAHGSDGISIRMLKLCTTSISKPLHILFNNSVISECFPNEWKKANVIPVHKKGDKQKINNYRPMSLLPICSKIFEKIIFNSLFEYLEENRLLNCNQSGFRSGDSCVHQLLSITHEIYKSFDANPSLEVRGVFLDISKVFDRV